LGDTLLKAIEFNSVSLRYDNCLALDAVSLCAEQGQVTAILGENGAGKTSALALMAGTQSPSRGRVLRGVGDQRALGYCPQEIAVWDNLTVKEQLLLVASLYGLEAREAGRRMEGITYELSLSGQEGKKARELSRGNRRKLNLALALIHDPELLVLDEPEAELDLETRERLFISLRKLSRERGKTLVISTHHPREAQAVADKVIIMRGGRISAEGPTAGLLNGEAGGLEAAYLRWARPEALEGDRP
jgi:ABC-2 type transport system ATP-binding protein